MLISNPIVQLCQMTYLAARICKIRPNRQGSQREQSIDIRIQGSLEEEGGERQINLLSITFLLLLCLHVPQTSLVALQQALNNSRAAPGASRNQTVSQPGWLWPHSQLWQPLSHLVCTLPPIRCCSRPCPRHLGAALLPVLSPGTAQHQP